MTKEGHSPGLTPARAPRRDCRPPGRRDGRVTINDVARVAGVSLGTVSNVLNHRAVVAAPTCRRVLEAIATTGFVRSTAAHQLRGGRSQTVGMVVPDLADPFFTEMVRGAEGVLRDQGYVLVVCSSDDSLEQERRYLRALEEHRVEGLLITPAAGDLSGAASLAARGVPTVLLGREAGSVGLCSVGLCSVTGDDVHGGDLAAGHLLDAEHRVLALVNGPLTVRQCADVRRGVQRALSRRRLRPADALVEVTAPALGVHHGQKVAASLLARRPRPTAVLCATDGLALGVLRGLASFGLAVPGDMAIVGYGDVDFASMLTPTLSSVRRAKYELGASAATLLLEEAGHGGHERRGHEHRSLRFEPELVVRDSSGWGPPAA